jgi:hypothetical protein
MAKSNHPILTGNERAVVVGSMVTDRTMLMSQIAQRKKEATHGQETDRHH